MTTTFAVAPNVTTYAQPTPYITLAEFLAAPTALEVTDLIPGGNQAVQNQALIDTILRASGWVDDLANQILACTLDIEQGRYRIDRDGYVNIPLHNKPILEVRGANLGVRVSQMVPLTDFSDVYVGRTSIKVPVFPLNTPTQFGLNGGWTIGQKLIAQITYVNGWVNTLLAATANANANQVQVKSALGIYPGSQFTINDGANTEQITVANTYVAGPGSSTIIPLASPLQFTHTVAAATPVALGNLPQVVKEATILLTCVLIQTRGNDAIILDSLENPQRMSDGYGSSGVSVKQATAMIRNLVRVR